MRRKLQSRERASDLASIVVPTPGTSSIKRWPSQSRVTRQSLISSSLLTIARLTLDMNDSATRPTVSADAPIPLGIIGGPSWRAIRVQYGRGLRLVPVQELVWDSAGLGPMLCFGRRISTAPPHPPPRERGGETPYESCRGAATGSPGSASARLR